MLYSAWKNFYQHTVTSASSVNTRMQSTPNTKTTNSITAQYLSKFLLLCFWCIGQLPLAFGLKLGHWFGLLSFWVLPRRRNIAAANIKLCFPELNEQAQQTLVKHCLIANIQGFFESAKAWWGNMQPILDQCDFIGYEHLAALESKQEACLLIGAHFTTLDMGGRIIGEVSPISILYRPMNNQVFDEAIFKARSQIYHSVMDKNKMRSLVRALKQKQTLWYPADQDYGMKDSVFASFFGIQAASLATTSGLATMGKCKLLGLFHHRLPDNRYRIEVCPIEVSDLSDPVATAQAVNDTTEAGIRKFPEQYMWVHRRFKTRPPGSDQSIYDT